MPITLTPSTQLHYASVDDIDRELGKVNADIAGNLSSSGANEDSPNEKEWALTKADVAVNEILNTASPVPLGEPLYVSTKLFVNGSINVGAAEIAAGELEYFRGEQANNTAQQKQGEARIAKGRARIQAIAAMPDNGIVTVTTTDDPDINDIGMVTAGASVTPDGLPKPPRCSYGYYDRLYGGWVYR